MHRFHLKNIALSAVLPILFASPAIAATVIDSFDLDSLTLSTTGTASTQSQNVTVGGNPAVRTLKASSNGTSLAQVVVKEGQFDFASLPSGGLGSTEYANFTLNASATPYLRFTIGTALSAGQVEIGATSSTAAGAIATIAQMPGSINSPTDIHFDLRTFPGYQPGFLNGIVSLAIAFNSGSNTDYFLKINEIALITEDEYGAVLPEPSLLALILPLAAIWSARRKPRS